MLSIGFIQSAGAAGRYCVGGPGFWLGRGSERLGLSGVVDHGQFEALLDGHHPFTGEPFAQRRARRAGYDLLFNAPRSLAITPEVLEAHRGAVGVSVSWIENEARMLRVGRGGERADSYGWIVAAFEHQMTRSGEPQLHTHCAVIGRAECVEDGRYLPIAEMLVYRSARRAGELYQQRLSERLDGLTVIGA